MKRHAVKIQLSKKTRPPVEQDRIVGWLRGELIAGTLRAGQRLPGRVALQERFGVSAMTVQRAFDRLIDDGTVEVRGRSGSFVAAAPPSLHEYILAHPMRASEVVRLGQVMEAVAPRIFTAPDRISAMTDLDQGLDTNNVEALCALVRERRVAGILFSTSPHPVQHTPLLQTPGLPRVAIGSTPRDDIGTILCPGGCMLTRAVRHLHEQGCRRVALITTPNADPPGLFAAELERWSLAYENRLHQCLVNRAGEWAGNLTRLLLALPRGERPDALIIRDDNLTDAACRALLELQIDPADLRVVTHCNFPAPAPVYPATQLGFDIEHLLRLARASLHAQQLGEAVEPFQRLDPVFAWER